MLCQLTSNIQEIACTDKVDETNSTCKWDKGINKILQKLNTNCNNTAGLEAKLVLAVGARVMLCRNIDTKAGLVNSALGTVQKIMPSYMRVLFDHNNLCHDVELVRSKFMVVKKFYICRKQFPLILAYAVTIHKCQSLSLDSAIIDLSVKVFTSGMVYVALSRVRTLSGLHLIP